MARTDNDAWTRIPPLDRLVEVIEGPPETRTVDPRATVGFSMYLKGAEAIFVAEGGGETVEVRFRYRRQARAWQMYRREGTRWVADGPASERAGRLLEKIVLVMLGADPKVVFG